MTRKDPAERLAARRERAERSVRAVGYWMPELLAAALSAAAAVWVWPGTWLAWPLWALAVLALARIPARPLLTRWRAHRNARATASNAGPPLLTDHPDRPVNAADDHAPRPAGRATDWEASA